ncbi:TPA: hypothetical protein ACXJF7_007007, partial [Burkholderia sola]
SCKKRHARIGIAPRTPRLRRRGITATADQPFGGLDPPGSRRYAGRFPRADCSHDRLAMNVRSTCAA